MELTFTHTLYRDSGHPELLDEIELTVTARVYMGEVDDIKWSPAIDLSRKEGEELERAAERELAVAIKSSAEEAAYYAREDAYLRQMEGW